MTIMIEADDLLQVVSLGLIVAMSTLIAGIWAERRRNRFRPSPNENLLGQFIIAVIFMIFYINFAFLVPAIILITILRAIKFLPKTTPGVVLVMTTVQVATLFSLGANFAVVASTYVRTTFWKHMRQYLVFVVPSYFATMGLAWCGGRALSSIDQPQPALILRTWRLFALPFLSPQREFNFLLLILIVFSVGAISYFLRKRGEERQ